MNEFVISGDGSNFLKGTALYAMEKFEEGSKLAAHTLWSVLIDGLKEHWLLIIGILFFIFIFVSLKALFGKWGSLYSFTYSSLYFGTLFIVGLIWGPEIFVEDIFNAVCTVILYPVCYKLVGLIWDQTPFGRNAGRPRGVSFR